MTDDPSNFYTGLVAELYAPLRGAVPDPAIYRRLVERSGEPALELGCGDGDPLLDLRRVGLDVEGLDSSADMLSRAQARADELGVEVVLHCADIRDFDVGRRYQTIYLAGPTFNLLASDADAVAALRCISAHLAAGGQATIPLFVPDAVPVADIDSPREQVRDDGSTISYRIVGVERDETARTQVSTLRYVREHGDDRAELTRPWLLHWYTPTGFTALAEAAGLRVIRCTDWAGRPADDSATEFVFRLGPASPDVDAGIGAALEEHRVTE